MAGPTIANAEVDVDLDGDGIVAQARRIANRAGDGFGRSFQQRLERSGILRAIPRLLAGSVGGGGDAGRRLAESFSEGFRVNLLRNLDNDVRLVIGLIVALAPQIAALGSGLSASLVGLLSSALVGLAGALLTVGGPAAALGLAIGMLARQWKNITAEGTALRSAVDSLNAAWSEQSRVMADLAARGIGPLIDSLATAIGSSNIGAGLGRAIQEIATAFDQVVGSSGFNSFLRALETTFPQALSLFGQSIAQITQGLLTMFAAAGPAAVQLGEAFLSWSTTFAAAMDRMAASGQLSAFFDQAVVSVQALMGFLLPLTQALGNVFLIGTASGDRMLGTLGELARQFLAFTQSVEGSQAITEWFANGEQIFNALLPLIGALGTMLATLVTPETINQVVSFLQAFTELTPVIGQVLGVIGELNLLNVVTQALLGIGTAIQPLLPMFSSLASAIGSVDPALIQGIAIGLAALFAAARAVGALLGLNRLLLLVTGGTTGLASALRVAGVALRGLFAVFLTNPIGLVITAVAALVAGLVYFFTQTETGRAAWSSFVSWLQDLWAGLSEWFTGSFLPAMQAVWDGLVSGVQGIGSFFSDAWNGLINAPQALVDYFTGTVIPFFQSLPEFMSAGLSVLGDRFMEAFQSVLSWFSGTFIPFILSLPGLIASGLGSLVGFFISLPGRIIGALANLTSWWLTFWTNLFVSVIGFITTGISNIVTFFQSLPARIQGVWAGFTAWWNAFWPALWNLATTAIANGISFVINYLTNFVSRVIATVRVLHRQFPQLFARMMEAAGAAVQRGVTRVISFFQNLLSRAVTLVSQLASRVPALLQSLWSRAVSAVNQGISRILSAISGLVSRFVGFIASLGRQFYSSMVSAMGDGNRAAIAGVANLVSTASQIPGRIISAIGNLGSTLYGAGADLISGLINGFVGAAGRLYEQAASVARGVVGAVTSVFDSHSPSKVFAGIGGDVVDGLVLGLDRNRRLAQNAAGGLARNTVDSFTNAAPSSSSTYSNTRNNNVAAGAIQIVTQTSSPEIAANMVLDRLVTRMA